MWNRFLPRQFDNTYSGYKAALWILGFVLVMKTGMGGNSVLNGYQVATRADGIPLQSYAAGAVQTILYLLAGWGWSQVLLSVLGVIVLVRYRSMVPLMFALQLAEIVGRKLIGRALPALRVGTPPAIWVNVTLIAVMAVGLILSLLRPARAAERLAGELS